MKQLSTVADLIRFMEQEHQNPKAFNDRVGEAWVSTSHEQCLAEVKALALWLVEAGVQKGERVGLLAAPSARWTIVDLACLAMGAVTVPLFGNISEENFVYECTQADIHLIFVSGDEQWAMWHRQKGLFGRTVSLDRQVEIPYELAISEGEVERLRHPDLFNELLSKGAPDDLATIIYTSGSTGIPKGVMLSQQALVADTFVDPMGWSAESDRYLSILPLAHVFGRSMNFIMLQWGIPIYYFNDLKNVGVACRETHPTIIALVPRLLEKVYAKMVANVEHSGLLKRTIGHWAFSLANNEEEGKIKALMHPLADKVVYSHLREALGGSLRVIISGGAPLNPHLCHFFIDVGMPIYEGYGLTEASIVSVNNPKERKIGSVGKKIETLEVALSSSGEVLVKGPIVFSGYYKNPKATQETLIDGWLHTGDKGTIDEEGFITIVGRIKELVKSSTGEYIAPVPIEQQLTKVPFIDLAMVVADKRKFVSALIFPNFEVVHSLKVSQNETALSDEEFLESPYIRGEMSNLLYNLNEHLNHWEQVRDYRFVMTPPTIESGELTPSMKLKRDVVSQRYSALIESMYQEVTE